MLSQTVSFIIFRHSGVETCFAHPDHGVAVYCRDRYGWDMSPFIFTDSSLTVWHTSTSCRTDKCKCMALRRYLCLGSGPNLFICNLDIGDLDISSHLCHRGIKEDCTVLYWLNVKQFSSGIIKKMKCKPEKSSKRDFEIMKKKYTSSSHAFL